MNKSAILNASMIRGQSIDSRNKRDLNVSQGNSHLNTITLPQSILHIRKASETYTEENTIKLFKMRQQNIVNIGSNLKQR